MTIKKNLLIGIGIFLFCFKMQGQRFVRGIIEGENQEPLPFASALLLTPDSTMVSNFQTEENGLFFLNIKNIEEVYILKISYVGYETYLKPLSLSSSNYKDTLDVGSIQLTPLSKLLDETVITAQRNPVSIKGDTIEFAASAYKTQPNDNADALIKQLPGVEVDRDGAVRAKGQDVKQIFVNGKPFFGGDPRLALANLPADAIESVQVYEKKSDQAEFTGVDDGQRDMTLNIIIKESYKKRTTGRLTGGYGSDSRYMGRGNVSQFNDGQQLTILGSANNVNRAGFSQDDFAAFTNNQRPANGQNPQQNESKGFQNVQSGGVNFAQNWGKKNEMNFSYFYNNLNVVNDRIINRQNFLPNGFYSTNSNSFLTTHNRSHRVNGFIDQKLDSLTSFRFSLNLYASENDWYSKSNSINKQGDTLRQNVARKLTDNQGEGLGVWSNLLLRRRLNKPGRTVSLNLAFGRNNSNRLNLSDALSEFYNPLTQELRRIDTINQTDKNLSERNNYSASLSYVEPLSKYWFAEANYRYSTILAESDRNVYNILRGELNNNLSVFYNSAFESHRLGTSLRFNKSIKSKMKENKPDSTGLNKSKEDNNNPTFNSSVGLQMQESLLRGDFASRNYFIRKPFRYVLPNARVEYSPSKGNRFNFLYETDVREPAIEQLQPVVNNNDPNNLYYGNPDLQPEYQNRLRLMFSNFNRKTYTYFNGNISYNFVQNKIVNELGVDTLLRRTFRPINIDGFSDANAHAAFGFRLWQQRIRLNFTSNLTYSKGKNPVNGVNNLTNRLNASLSSRAELRFQDTFEIAIKAVIRRNATQYSIQTNLNQTFWIYDYEAEMTLNLPADMRLNTSLDYNILAANIFGKTQGIPIWTAYLGKYFQKRRYELRLTVVDILNRNTGINRTADANYIQEEIVRSLGRYALLSFTYSINKRRQKGDK